MLLLRIVASFMLAFTLLFSLPATAFCFNEAGARYKVDPLLLRSIAQVESSLNPRAIGENVFIGKRRNPPKNYKPTVKSRDYGLMQINDVHIPQLRALGILKNEQDLLNNPCLNVQIGAWILAKHLQQCGVNWECLGSYNAGFAGNNSARRMLYARKVYAKYIKLKGGAT
ncbi:lytic transglycosylase domain-containing protein [Serratia marcescens]|uniref:lytic transglycosylase domain-containing protein n=1 Tax=Serratia marcescens TaxID=615 RepID=UPI003EE363EB